MRFCFLLLCFLVSCSNPRIGWYEAIRCGDLRLIPLIKPYQLCAANDEDSLWSFSFVNNGKLDECDINNNHEYQITVLWINVKNNIIYGYCDEYSNYFVVIPGRKIEKKFSKKNEWLLYLNEVHIDTDTFYRPDKLYKILENGSERYKELPWYNQIKDSIK